MDFPRRWGSSICFRDVVCFPWMGGGEFVFVVIFFSELGVMGRLVVLGDLGVLRVFWGYSVDLRMRRMRY